MSMKCPACHKKGSVLESRPRANHVTYRRYVCSKCPTRWSTVEQLVKIGKKRGKPGGSQSLIKELHAKQKAQISQKMRAELKALLNI